MNPVNITYAGINDGVTIKLGSKRRDDNDDEDVNSDDESYTPDDEVDTESESDDDDNGKGVSYKTKTAPKNINKTTNSDNDDDDDEDVESSSDSGLDNDDKLSDSSYEGKNRNDDDEGDDDDNQNSKHDNDNSGSDDENDVDERDVEIDEDYDNENESDNGDEKYRKINEVFRKNYIIETHPEAQSHTDEEIHALARVVRDKTGAIVDPLHKTLPILTKYEKTRILGIRTKQINGGAEPFITSKINTTTDKIVDGYHIALRELEEKRLPFIISRPLPGGGTEYWYLQDLEVL
jgi:DNA-directed RNA polymerase subunit K/omega